MTKIIRTLLPIGAATVMAFSSGNATAGDFVTDGIRYQTLDETTATVKKYVEGSEIEIPSVVTDEDGNEYTVVSIASQAFYNARISSIKLPSTVKNIEQFAFWKAALESIEFSEGLESICYAAFRECPNLTEVVLPNSLQEIGAVGSYGFGGVTFSGCGNLAKVVVGENVKELPEQTFVNCGSLTEVILSEGLESIGERVFENCAALDEVVLPTTLTTMGRAAFMNSGVTTAVIPANLTIIPNSAFLWCGSLTSVDIQEGVVEVGKQSFADCPAIREVRLPNSVEWVRTDAFQGNGNVQSIHLGSGLRRLGHASLAVWEPSAMTNEPQWTLTDIYLLSEIPPYHEQNDDHFDIVDDDFFFGGKEFTDELREKFHAEVTLHVPEGAEEAYKEADIWKEFVNIVGDANKTDGVDVAEATAKTLTIENGVVSSATKGIRVYNLTGAQVATTAGTTLDISVLAPGVYVVHADESAVKTVVK